MRDGEGRRRFPTGAITTRGPHLSEPRQRESAGARGRKEGRKELSGEKCSGQRGHRLRPPTARAWPPAGPAGRAQKRGSSPTAVQAACRKRGQAGLPEAAPCWAGSTSCHLSLQEVGFPSHPLSRRGRPKPGGTGSSLPKPCCSATKADRHQHHVDQERGRGTADPGVTGEPGRWSKASEGPSGIARSASCPHRPQNSHGPAGVPWLQGTRPTSHSPSHWSWARCSRRRPPRMSPGPGTRGCEAQYRARLGPWRPGPLWPWGGALPGGGGRKAQRGAVPKPGGSQGSNDREKTHGRSGPLSCLM